MTTKVCEVELLIRSTKGLVCPSKESNRQIFSEEFKTKRSIMTEKSIITEESVITKISIII